MERTQHHPREPLGKYPYTVRISRAEVHLAYLRKQETGEPIESWIRRLIRENWDSTASTQLTSKLYDTGDQS
jgi:hypothetical protein